MYKYINGLGLVPLVGSSYEGFIIHEANISSGARTEPPFSLVKCVTYVFEPGFFEATEDDGAIYINTTFHIPERTGWDNGKPFLNTSRRPPFDYNYNVSDVTQPYLTDAVLEVAVW
jgi:hypothetical protein